MPSQRKRRTQVNTYMDLQRKRAFDQELRLWDGMPPIGREFGSPDFERLMDEDWRAGVGVFDPALKSMFDKPL